MFERLKLISFSFEILKFSLSFDVHIVFEHGPEEQRFSCTAKLGKGKTMYQVVKNFYILA